MQMPFRTRMTQKKEWRVNTSDEKLDEAYDRFIGRAGGKDTRGRDLLDEQTKVH